MKPGWVNIDNHHPKADKQADVLELDYEAQSVDQIVWYHGPEHLHREDTEELLRRCHKWLRPRGTLELEFPDILKVCCLVIQNHGNHKEREHGPQGLRGIFGDPQYMKTNPGYLHLWAYSEISMEELLRRVGFTQIHTEKPTTHDKSGRRDSRVVAMK